MPDSILHMLSAAPRDRLPPRDGQTPPPLSGAGFALHLAKDGTPLPDLAIPTAVIPDDQLVEGATEETVLHAEVPQDRELLSAHQNGMFFFSAEKVPLDPLPDMVVGAEQGAIDPAANLDGAVARPDAVVAPGAVPPQAPVTSAHVQPIADIAPRAAAIGAQAGPVAMAATPQPQQAQGALATAALLSQPAQATPLPVQAQSGAIVVPTGASRRDVPAPSREAPVAQVAFGTNVPTADIRAAYAQAVAAPAHIPATLGAFPQLPMTPAPLPEALGRIIASDSALRGSSEALGTTAIFGSQPSASLGGTSPVAAQTAPTLPAVQVAQAIAVATADRFEISLSPEELGRVRIQLQPSEAGVQVLILTERPETLELLRKNIGLLGRELSDLGFDDLTFQFGQQDKNDGQKSETPHMTLMSEPDDQPRDAAPDTAAARALTAGRGIDLRF
jgi:hypothetical protein